MKFDALLEKISKKRKRLERRADSKDENEPNILIDSIKIIIYAYKVNVFYDNHVYLFFSL